MSNQINDTIAKQAILAKLTNERCTAYIKSAHAILHIHCDEEFSDGPAYRNLWQVLDQISKNLDMLDETFAEHTLKSKSAENNQAA